MTIVLWCHSLKPITIRYRFTSVWCFWNFQGRCSHADQLRLNSGVRSNNMNSVLWKHNVNTLLLLLQRFRSVSSDLYQYIYVLLYSTDEDPNLWVKSFAINLRDVSTKLSLQGEANYKQSSVYDCRNRLSVLRSRCACSKIIKISVLERYSFIWR